MTTTIDAHDTVEMYPLHSHADFIAAVASLNAMGFRGDAGPLQPKPRWRPTEEDVVRTSISVILVALMAMIGLAAGAILTTALAAVGSG